MQKEIIIPEDKNRLTISVSNSKSIEVKDQKGHVIGSMKSKDITTPQIFHVRGGEYKIVTDGKIDDIAIEPEEPPTLVEFARLGLMSDANDFHVVDGIPEIPADGESFTTITIQKMTDEGKQLTRVKDDEEIFLRTNAGMIKDEKGYKEIRSMGLKNGKGIFRLYSEDRKRVATVEVISADPFLIDASIKIEFI